MEPQPSGREPGVAEEALLLADLRAGKETAFERLLRPMSELSVTCREVLNFLWSYLSGELEPEKQKKFDEHLEVCPSCVAYIGSYKSTIELSKGAFQDPACEPGIAEVPEDLVKAVMAVRRKDE